MYCVGFENSQWRTQTSHNDLFFSLLNLDMVPRNSPDFTVTGGNEAGVDLVLIQPFLLCYVNLSLTFTQRLGY